MKGKAYGQHAKLSNGVLNKSIKTKKQFKEKTLLNMMPYVVLRELATFLYGYDALAFAEVTSNLVMDSERQFWKSIGIVTSRIARYNFDLLHPTTNYYLISVHYFIQTSSNRVYNHFIYGGFLPEHLLSVMNSCKSKSFQTYARLHPYSYHQVSYNMPIFSFFQYGFMYENRNFNCIEMNLFQICRVGCLQETKTNIIVDNIEIFENNLNNRFGFSHIKHMINFSLFVMAGGAVLNSLLINGFDSTLQDLDFFWLGGSWVCFVNAIERFKRKARLAIFEERNIHGKVIEFILMIENQRKIRIQFIFGRIDANIPFVLYTFDIDIVQVAYDGERIISTIGFFQAIATRSFICYSLTNNIFDSPFYVDRCCKYNLRGFTWICPLKYHQNLAQKPIIAKKKIVDYGFNDFYFNVDSFGVQYDFLRLNLFE